jgi:peroxiredoxin
MRRLALFSLLAALTGCASMMRGPVEGMKAPPIEGTDVLGGPVNLADHHGKVVLLSFWHSHCPPCRALFRREKALVERFAGRPFVLLGVNADVELEQARRCHQQAGLTWASCWDGPPAKGADGKDGVGPICSAWKVDRFPTLFLIDRDGVVRYKQVGTPADGALEARIEELLRK